jgi:hypothetical protein
MKALQERKESAITARSTRMDLANMVRDIAWFDW